MPPGVRDQVPWDRLWVHEAKDARGVPKLVRRVGQLRGSQRVRSAAFAALARQLEHRGALSPATVHVIPRLFAILRERPGRPWQRRALLALLSRFAVPQPGDLFPALVDPDRDYAGLDPRRFHACADPEIARACFLAVEEGAPSLAHMVDDPSDRVACEAIGLLSLFARHAAQTIAVLPCSGRAPAVHACALVAHARLTGGGWAAACAALEPEPPADALPYAFAGSWADVRSLAARRGGA